MTDWISVENRLPELGRWYLVTASDFGNCITTMAFLDSTNPVIWLSHEDTEADEWHKVKYWAPLPEPMDA